MKPLLSIVTVTYKDAPGLSATLASLRGLSLAPDSWELIVVDSSPEENREALANPPPHLRHIVSPPKGIYAAMNVGLAAAQSEFVWFLNGGDRLHTAKNLVDLISLLRNFPQAELGLAAADLLRDGKFLYRKNPKSGVFPLLGMNRVCHQSIVYKKDLLAQLGGYSEKYRLAADYELHLRALAIGVKSVRLMEPIVQYDMSGQSSQYAHAFSEFAAIHRDLSQRNELRFFFLHKTIYRLERAKLDLFQKLRAMPLGGLLQKAWIQFQRMRS